MRRYDEPVEVRQGLVTGVEGPAQFLWRGRLWKVRAVLAHWVETGPWWQAAGVRAALGTDDAGAEAKPVSLGEAMTERELWRVEAGRGAAGRRTDDPEGPRGVFELSFDWAEGRWQLVGCSD